MKSAIAFALLALIAKDSYAACSIHSPGNCLSDPITPITGVFAENYDVHVKNLCARAIYVGIYHQPIPDGSSSTLACDGCAPDAWIGAGWWRLGIGESKFIAETKNRYVYFAAESEDGELTWGSDDLQFKIRGELSPTFEVSLGPSFRQFTQTFTCN